jgi:hypothetical protein
LLFLKENYFIETSFDIYGISYNDIISVKIIRQNFDPIGNYTKLYGDDLDRILNIGTTLNKESLLVVFLYIASYIGCRKRQSDGSDYPGAQDHPEAFWKSLDGMAKELSMSKDTINQSIDYLVTPSDLNAALLIKKEVGSIRADQGKVLKNVPNIYVLNKEGYQQEIQWALDKMCETYRVDEFHSVIGTEQRKDNEEC